MKGTENPFVSLQSHAVTVTSLSYLIKYQFVHLINCLRKGNFRTFQDVFKLSPMESAYNPGYLRSWGQEDQKFKVCLNCRVSSRSIWGIQRTGSYEAWLQILQTRKQKRFSKFCLTFYFSVLKIKSRASRKVGQLDTLQRQHNGGFKRLHCGCILCNFNTYSFHFPITKF